MQHNQNTAQYSVGLLGGTFLLLPLSRGNAFRRHLCRVSEHASGARPAPSLLFLVLVVRTLGESHLVGVLGLGETLAAAVAAAVYTYNSSILVNNS